MTLMEHPWWREGARVTLSIGGTRHKVFVRADDRHSEKPWLTLMHGFPSSSWDFHRVWSALTAHFRVLALDFLGYGASDKGSLLRLSTSLHVDTVTALWAHLGIERTQIFGHDIGTAVTQELLARKADGVGSCEIDRAFLSNGAVFIDRYRASLLQRLLMHPFTGPLIASRMSERRFVRGLGRAFTHETVPSADELVMVWRAMSERGGHRQLHRLLHHIPERVALRQRWEGVLHTTDVPLHFLWGRRDRFVGFVADDIRRHLPQAPLHELDVGHFPQLEAPDAVVAVVCDS